MKMPPKKKSQKGIFPIVIKAENVKATQPNKTGNVATTPFKKTKKST